MLVTTPNTHTPLMGITGCKMGSSWTDIERVYHYIGSNITMWDHRYRWRLDGQLRWIKKRLRKVLTELLFPWWRARVDDQIREGWYSSSDVFTHTETSAARSDAITVQIETKQLSRLRRIPLTQKINNWIVNYLLLSTLNRKLSPFVHDHKRRNYCYLRKIIWFILSSKL